MSSPNSSRSDHRVVVADQADDDVAVVAHHRDRERALGRQERHGHQLLHLAPDQVERELRSRHVGHQQVVRAGREVEPRRLCEDRRRREVLQPREGLGPDRLLGLLQPAHRLRHDAVALDRVLRVDRQRPEHRGDPVAERAPLRRRRGSRPGRCARSSSPSVRTPWRRSQRPSAPDTTARKTSLTVPPSAFLIAFSSSSGNSSHRTRRCGPIGHVQRRLGRRVREVPGDVAEPLPRLAHARRPSRAAAGPRRAPAGPTRVGRPAMPFTPSATSARRSARPPASSSRPRSASGSATCRTGRS